MGYTTAQKVADLIGLSSSTAIKSDWLTWADSYIETMTGQTFSETTVTDEYYDGSDLKELILKGHPITSMTKVEYRDEDEDWVEVDLEYIKTYSDEGIIKLYDVQSDLEIDVFEEGIQNWRISYKYGYASTPKKVEFLATLVTADLYYKSVGRQSVISSEHIGDYSVSFGNNSVIAIPELISQLIRELKVNNNIIRGI